MLSATLRDLSYRKLQTSARHVVGRAIHATRKRTTYYRPDSPTLPHVEHRGRVKCADVVVPREVVGIEGKNALDHVSGLGAERMIQLGAAQQNIRVNKDTHQ